MIKMKLHKLTKLPVLKKESINANAIAMEDITSLNVKVNGDYNMGRMSIYND